MLVLTSGSWSLLCKNEEALRVHNNFTTIKVILSGVVENSEQ